jgi:hypothetical protein
MGLNKQYKDSVFSLLFSNSDTLRELYGAIRGVSLDPSVPITINTLEGVLFMERVNDVSFEIGGKLVILIEHQSTINPNMALRLLLYIARIYEKIIDSKKIYSGRKLPIPRPEFIVLYNGPGPYPDQSTIRLSDSYGRDGPPGLPERGPPELELTVTVYNINEGRNEALVRRSERLYGYSAFIAKVRELGEKTGDKETAMKEAISYCIKHEILSGFLKENASEVINMLLTEWNWDDALEVRRQEGVEEGIAKGIEEGRAEGIEEGIAKGIAEGRVEGIAEGRAEGIEEDREEILKLIDAGYTAEALRERLMAERAKHGRMENAGK